MKLLWKLVPFPGTSFQSKNCLIIMTTRFDKMLKFTCASRPKHIYLAQLVNSNSKFSFTSNSNIHCDVNSKLMAVSSTPLHLVLRQRMSENVLVGFGFFSDMFVQFRRIIARCLSILDRFWPFLFDFQSLSLVFHCSHRLFKGFLTILVSFNFYAKTEWSP